ncbi:MAG: DUF2520 domain-containing protein [Cyclobacteriaceae bacterium]|nr:DUF2520 domain-containing protein [Cyclobacteriaceae bacterium HetDA_MAG_MS6]
MTPRPTALSVSFIGIGNVAFHLIAVCLEKGIPIDTVRGRNATQLQGLAEHFKNALDISESKDLSSLNSDLIFIAVPDHAISNVLETYIFPERSVVVHTSGSTPLTIFDRIRKPFGVFYPLQTFNKTRPVSFSQIPIFIEGDSKETESVLSTLASRLSENVRSMDSYQRAVLHLAAIFANNFTNHLMQIAQEILEEEGLDFGDLEALLAETFFKASAISPTQAQTGPAVRNDLSTIKNHLTLLKNPKHRELYQLISQSISNKKH